MKRRPGGGPRLSRLRPGRHESRTPRVAWSVVGPHGIGNAGFGGHERSRPVRRNHWSPHLPDQDLGEWCSETAGSNPSSNCRMPYRTLACEARGKASAINGIESVKRNAPTLKSTTRPTSRGTAAAFYG